MLWSVTHHSGSTHLRWSKQWLFWFLIRSCPLANYALPLVQLPEFKLLKDFCCGEDAGVDDTGDGEGAADDGADCGEEVVEWGPRLVVAHRYRVQVVPAS